MMSETIEPEVIDAFSEAVQSGPDCEKFDIARKILTLATLLGKDVIAPETAAKEADEALFSKSVECKVGDGRMSAEEGTEAIVDRKASGFVTTVRTMIATAVEVGFESIGYAIGSAVGAPEVGRMAGSAVAHFLNEPVGEIVSRGARAVVSYAQNVWQSARNIASQIANSISDFLFS